VVAVSLGSKSAPGYGFPVDRKRRNPSLVSYVRFGRLL
jgi:hypothetical protein